MASLLLDQFGAPHQGYGGRGGLIDATRPSLRNGPVEPTRMESLAQSVTYYDWQTLVSASRKLVWNYPILEGAISLKAIHAVGRGWDPVFLGRAIDWGKRATDWLLECFYPVCDVRGSSFADFKTGLYLDSSAMDTDGDNAILLTESEEGSAQIQRLPCHRIGQLNYGSAIVQEEDAVSLVPGGDGEYITVPTLYAGMRIEQGIIYNRKGRAVAARIIGDRSCKPQDVSMRDLDFRFDPRAADQGRGLPVFAGSLEFLRSCFTSHQYEQQALLLAGSIGLIEWNESGGVDTRDLANLGAEIPTASCAPKMEMMEGGTTRYYKMGTAAKVEAMEPSNRPGQAWTDFNDRIVRLALCGAGVPYSLAWKAEGLNGVQERSAIEQMRAVVKDRQDLLLPRARRIVSYAISKAIKNGDLPGYPGDDLGGQLKWGFEMPPEFSIDHGREDEQARQNILFGLGTVSQYLRRAGGKTDVKEHWKEKAREAGWKQLAVQEIEQEFALAGTPVSIDPREIQMLTPNDMAQPDETEDPQATPPAQVAPETVN